MNLEGMTLRVLTKELRDHLENGRIYTIEATPVTPASRTAILWEIPRFMDMGF